MQPYGRKVNDPFYDDAWDGETNEMPTRPSQDPPAPPGPSYFQTRQPITSPSAGVTPILAQQEEKIRELQREIAIAQQERDQYKASLIALEQTFGGVVAQMTSVLQRIDRGDIGIPEIHAIFKDIRRERFFPSASPLVNATNEFVSTALKSRKFLLRAEELFPEFWFATLRLGKALGLLQKKD